MKITAYHNGNLDKGIKEGHLYFTDDKNTANWYGDGKLYQVDLDLSNPIIFETSEEYDVYIESILDWGDVLEQGYDSIICEEEPKYYVALLPRKQVKSLKLAETFCEDNQKIRTVDLTNMFDHQPKENEARAFVMELFKESGTFETATPNWSITFDVRKYARGHIYHPNGFNQYLSDGTLNPDRYSNQKKIRHNKAILCLKELISNSIYGGMKDKIDKDKDNPKKKNVQDYFYFLVNVRIGKLLYYFKIDTERYIDEPLTSPMVTHMYNIEEYKKPTVILESYFNSINTITVGCNNIIEHNSEKFNTTIKNYKLECMKEDLTFFKDDKERNKDGSRTKNPNRVFAAKKAHKTHGFSYKQANNHRGDKLMDNKKQDRASLVAEALEKYINEAELDQDNAVNLYGLINFNNTTGGIQVQFDEENYSNVDITLVAQDQEGVGAYQIESENNDKSQASTIFNALMTDLKVLADNFDRDFESVLKKNGVVRRVQ